MIERLEEIRKINGLNQAEFAFRLGLQPGSYSDIKKGKLKTGISRKVLNKLEIEFLVNLEWLKKGEGEMFIKDAKEPLPALISPISSPEIKENNYDVYLEIEQLKTMMKELSSTFNLLLEKSLSESRLNEILARTIEKLTDNPPVKSEPPQNKAEGNPSKNYLDKAG